jgi:MFS family permease
MLPSAIALSTSTWSSAALAGPALAGALLTVIGPGLIFAINGACTLVALGAVASLRSTTPAQPMDGNGFAQLAGGIAYLRSHRPVLWLEGVLLHRAGRNHRQRGHPSRPAHRARQPPARDHWAVLTCGQHA